MKTLIAVLISMAVVGTALAQDVKITYEKLFDVTDNPSALECYKQNGTGAVLYKLAEDGTGTWAAQVCLKQTN